MSDERTALELHQTREFTAREQRALLDLWRKVQWPDGAGRWHTIALYLYYAFAGFLVFSVLQAAYELSSSAPERALQLTIATVGCAVALAASQLITTRVWRRAYWQAASANNRFVIQADGLRSVGADSEALFRWRGIVQPIRTDRFIAIGSSGRWLLLAKAAFENQDVERFCAELDRRWHAAREIAP